MDDGSRMSCEVHVRFCEGPKVKPLRPTHPYIPMSCGFLYLVAIIDWASRAVLAWRLSNTNDASFCAAALEEALLRFGKPRIFNTDQGSTFTADAFTSKLVTAGRTGRTGRRADAASPRDRTRNAGTDWPGSAKRRRLAACPCRAPEAAPPRFASALSANARRRAGSRVPDSACAEPSSGDRDRDCRTAPGCRTPPPSLGPSNGVWWRRSPPAPISPDDSHKNRGGRPDQAVAQATS